MTGISIGEGADLGCGIVAKVSRRRGIAFFSSMVLSLTIPTDIDCRRFTPCADIATNSSLLPDTCIVESG